MPDQNSSTEEKKKQMDKVYAVFEKKIGILRKIFEKMKEKNKDK